jgi:bile acid-coenzyme A ligase
VTDTPVGEVSYGRRLTQIANEKPDQADLIMVARDGTERPVPWRELEDRANQIARFLESQGASQGDIVALAFPNCLDHILVTLGIWKLGATLLPLRHDIPQWEMSRLLELAKPVVLVSDHHTADTCPVVTSDHLASTTALSNEPLEDRVSEFANLIASSGSTGTPKLIAAPTRAVVADDDIGLIDPSKAPTILVTSPLYHVNGFNFASPPLLEGARSIVMEKFDAALAVELIEKHQVTITVMVPTMLQRVARLDGLRPEQFQSIQRLVYGGAKIPEWLVDRWIELVGPEVFTFTYGSSERIGLVQMSGAEWADHRGSTGRPVDCALSIRDPEGNELPAGEVGQIFMKPLDPNRRTFEYIGIETPDPTPDGYYTIGDLGWLDEDGYLYIADRRKDMIITGGANVFPAEVETALSEHPDVTDQVVVGVPDEEWGHRVHAIIQARDPASPPEEDQLRAHCKERLASYKVPKSFELVERVPRTEAGKLNRTQLGEERAVDSS